MRFKEFMNPHKSIGVITAHNPNGKKIKPEVNAFLNLKLADDIKALGLIAKKMRGEYNNMKELSFVVFDIKKNDLIRLGRKYKQKSVRWGEKVNGKFKFENIVL